MRKYLLTTLLLLITAPIFAQFVITNGKSNIEVFSNFSGFYNDQILKPGEVDGSKNRFKLRDAQLGIEGHFGNDFECSLKVDFADMAANNINKVIDPETPGL